MNFLHLNTLTKINWSENHEPNFVYLIKNERDWISFNWQSLQNSKNITGILLHENIIFLLQLARTVATILDILIVSNIVYSGAVNLREKYFKSKISYFIVCCEKWKNLSKQNLIYNWVQTVRGATQPPKGCEQFEVMKYLI